MFEQRDEFMYASETKDVYGTITQAAPIYYLGYNEQLTKYTSNGIVLAKGSIFTTDGTDFLIDAIVTFDNGDSFTIVGKEVCNYPGKYYQELLYV